MGVVVLRWPEEAEEVERLSSQGVAHLLLVSPDAPPPENDDPLEDWVRLPVHDRDIVARMIALERNAARLPARPELDRYGRISFRSRWTALSPIEREITRPLVVRYGDVVAAAELTKRAWPDSEPSDNAFRVHLTRLRRRIAPLGLELVNLRDHGVVLQEAPGSGPGTPDRTTPRRRSTRRNP